MQMVERVEIIVIPVFLMWTETSHSIPLCRKKVTLVETKLLLRPNCLTLRLGGFNELCASEVI